MKFNVSTVMILKQSLLFIQTLVLAGCQACSQLQTSQPK